MARPTVLKIRYQPRKQRWTLSPAGRTQNNVRFFRHKADAQQTARKMKAKPQNHIARIDTFTKNGELQ